jgi:hypothetical protein
MRLRIAAGIGAGLVAGLVFAVVMRALPVSAADGSQITMITFAARLIHAGHRAGWLAYVVYAVVLGGLFGASLPARRMTRLRTAAVGAVWGAGWFAVSGFGLVPALLGSRPFSADALRTLGTIAVPLLAGHIIYGLVLGAGVSMIVNALDPPGGSDRTQHGIRRAA